MNQLSIEKNGDYFKIILQPRPIGLLIKATLFIVTLSAILLPIKILFTNNASQGQIIMAIVSGFCAAFLIRLMMWNLFGKEIFEVNDVSIKHYIDYRFFTDNLCTIENRNYINLHAVAEDDEKVTTELLDSIPDKEKNGYFHLAISDHNSLLSQSNLSLTSSQIQEILNLDLLKT